jgi:K+-transporting ATPase ATPase A chain
MISTGVLQLSIYTIVLIALAIPLGNYMAQVYSRNVGAQARDPVTNSLLWCESKIYSLAKIDATAEMGWFAYAQCFLIFNAAGMLFVYAIQRLQPLLPGNPENLSGVSPDCAFNTAVSFASNTNWQSYSGETTMSYLTQMLALTSQNFLSAAAGMTVLVALIRAFARQQADSVGNFFVDLVRSIIFILLPLSTVLALTLVSLGVVQTFNGSLEYKPVEALNLNYKSTDSSHLAKLARGPVASQIAIKQLGTNGGGFFGVNSCHPFENAGALSNFLEMLAILLIPAALCQTFGKMVGSQKNGLALLAAMTFIFLLLLSVCYGFENAGNPAFTTLGIDQLSSDINSGGNMEGKEVRFGVANSALWAVATTAASNGSVNSMHDSFTPMAGLVPMLLMQLGEVVFGGVGSGLYGMVVFALITVFIAGLMVGRTPEYLGKKIEAYEIKMASLVILFPPMMVLLGTALAVSVSAGTVAVLNPGAHGFSEILYAFSSASNNNGSAFAGLSVNTPFYNYALGVSMFVGRYMLAIPVLALAGSLAAKKKIEAGNGTMATDNWLFVALLIGVVMIFGGLTFVPSLALGPVVEQLQMTFER